MKDRQTLAGITTKALTGLDDVMKEAEARYRSCSRRYNDNICRSLAAFYNQIIIGHVEAGLRTWNKYSPYPEEMNRQLTGAMADLHFAPTATS